jgi:hypothetical protein
VTFDVMVGGSGLRGAVTVRCLAEAGGMPTLPYKFRSTSRLTKTLRPTSYCHSPAVPHGLPRLRSHIWMGWSRQL